MPRGRKTGGRQKGTPNKSTATAQLAIAKLIEDHAHKFHTWLLAIEEKKGPEAAWDKLVQLLEFHVPKLARTELTGKDGKDLKLPVVTVELHPGSKP